MSFESQNRNRTGWRVLPLSAALAAALCGTASAATLVVNSPSAGAVANKCSVVDAVASINLGYAAGKGQCRNTGAAYGVDDTIVFARNFAISFTRPADGAASALVLTKPATIAGNADFAGHPLVSLVRSASATGNFRLIESSAPLTLKNLVIAGGDVDGDGGGVLMSANAPLIVANSTVSGNSASGRGGGVFAGNRGATVRLSTVSGNFAEEGGGGIYTEVGRIELDRATISGNAAPLGGGVVAGALFSSASTISGNSARWGAGAYTMQPSQVVDTTISGNAAGESGGGIMATGSMSFRFSTISGNSVAAGGSGSGVVLFFDGSDSIASIIQGNSGASDIDGPYRATLGGDHNIVGTFGANVRVPADTRYCDPLLAPLMYDGGPTMTQPPKASSCAINAGPASAATATDQRGRARLYGFMTDIGAVENQGPADTLN